MPRSLSRLVWLGIVVSLLLPTAVAPALAQTSATSTVIANGGFENGARPWVRSSSGGRQLITTTRPYRGSYSASLGGYVGGRDSIYQTITIPPDATLTYYWFMTTQESGTTTRDALQARLFTSDGQPVATLQTISNLSRSRAWNRKSVSLARFAGQTLRLQFRATNSATRPTSFFIDNVVVNTPAPPPLDAEERAFLTEINNYRRANGLVALVVNSNLTAAADWLSRDMASKNYFSHTDSLGRDPYQRMADFGYTYRSAAGENIAAGNSGGAAVFEQWRNSPDHNANMLDSRFRAIGIGRAYGADSTYGWYWTTTFGDQ